MHGSGARTATPASAPGALADRTGVGRLERAVLTVAIAWIAVVLFVRWPAFSRRLFVSDSNIDAAFFGFAGELLRTGGTPYVSYWDHKPPLIHLVNAAALTLSGGRVWGLWIASLAVLVSALVLGFRTLQRAYGGSGALLGTTYFAFTLPAVLASNLTEEYALPLQWLAVLLLLRWRPAEDAMHRLGVPLGVLAGLSFFLRANLVGAMVSVAVVLSVILLTERRIGAWLRLVGGGLTGVGLVAAPVIGYLALHGSLGPFWDQAFHYNFLYSATNWGFRVRAALQGLTFTTVFGSFVLPFAGWIFAAYRLRMGPRTDEERGILLLALVWLPIELGLASMSGRPYGHYFVTLLAPLSFLAGRFAHETVSAGPSLRDRSGWSGPRGAVAALSAGIALFAAGKTLIDVRDSGVWEGRAAQVAAVADYVRTHSDERDAILVWGHAADVYFFSDRVPASRFIYALPLLTPDYADPALIAEFLNEVRTAEPLLIVDATFSSLAGEKIVPSLQTWDPLWRFPEYGSRDRAWWSMTPALEEFYTFVRDNYEAVETIGPWEWTVYRRLPAFAVASGRAPVTSDAYPGRAGHSPQGQNQANDRD